MLFSYSVVSDSFWPHCTAAHQASLSFTISRSLFRLMPIELVIPSSHLVRCCPLLLLPSIFPTIRVFSSGGQSIGASTSAFAMNTHGWFPLRLTGLISLLFRVLSRVLSSTTNWKHLFFVAQPSLWSNSYDYWKTIALTIQTFVGKVMFLLFNTLSRFVMAFLPRSKHLLMSWLQGFPGGSAVNNLPAVQEFQETQVQSLGWEDPLEEDMATYSSILAWRIPWTEEPGWLQSIRSQRVRWTEVT